jgi:hypothetical protein
MLDCLAVTRKLNEAGSLIPSSAEISLSCFPVATSNMVRDDTCAFDDTGRKGASATLPLQQRPLIRTQFDFRSNSHRAPLTIRRSFSNTGYYLQQILARTRAGAVVCFIQCSYPI